MRKGTLRLDESMLEEVCRREYRPRTAERMPSFLDDREALEEEMYAGIERYESSWAGEEEGCESVEWDDLLAA